MRWRSCCVWACAASRHKRQFNVSPKFVLRHVPNVGATAAQSGVRWAELDGEGKLVTLHIPCSYFFRFRFQGLGLSLGLGFRFERLGFRFEGLGFRRPSRSYILSGTAL